MGFYQTFDVEPPAASSAREIAPHAEQTASTFSTALGHERDMHRILRELGKLEDQGIVPKDYLKSVLSDTDYPVNDRLEALQDLYRFMTSKKPITEPDIEQHPIINHALRGMQQQQLREQAKPHTEVAEPLPVILPARSAQRAELVQQQAAFETAISYADAIDFVSQTGPGRTPFVERGQNKGRTV